MLSPVSQAEQKQTFANQEVHYIALNSTFLTPKIARAYKIKRSGYNALINISVLDTNQVGNPSISANLTGTAKNLLGNVTPLEFRENSRDQWADPKREPRQTPIERMLHRESRTDTFGGPIHKKEDLHF